LRLPRLRRHGSTDRVGRLLFAGALVVTAAICLPVPGRAAVADPSIRLKTVAAVRLEGIHHVGKREVRRVLKTRKPSVWPWAARPPLRYDFVLADTANIASVYRQYGYLDVVVRDTVLPAHDPNEVEVVFRVTEGPRSYIRALSFAGVNAVPHAVLQKKLYARVGRPFNPAYLIADTALIAREYQERGYLPNVTASALRDSADPLRIAVIDSVDEGPLYKVGPVYLNTEGTVGVNERLIRREIVLKPGTNFRYSRMQETQERIYETGLFSQVQITPLPDSTGQTMEFLLQVRERKPRWFDAGVGSGTQERFSFNGEWGHRNLIGDGLEGILAGRLSLDGKGKFLLSRGEATLLEPWLLKTRNRAQATIYVERQRDLTTHPDTTVIKKSARGVSFQIQRDFGRLTHLRLIQDNTYVTQHAEFIRNPPLRATEEDSLLGDFLTDYSTHRLQLSGDRDRRDSPVNPLRGSLQNASAEIAGGPFKGSTSFTRYQVGSSWYSPTPFIGWVLATHARAGVIKPFGEKNSFVPAAGLDRDVARVPTEDLFRLGGVSSVRGYDENEIARTGGLALLQANLELRIPLVGPFGAELFVDAGNVWARPEYIRMKDFTPRFTDAALSPSDVRYVYGAGARFNLPFGPMRVDFTWGTRPEQGENRIAGRWQFAIGNAF
jgi:outer membrane protein insertion porin family